MLNVVRLRDRPTARADSQPGFPSQKSVGQIRRPGLKSSRRPGTNYLQPITEELPLQRPPTHRTVARAASQTTNSKSVARSKIGRDRARSKVSSRSSDLESARASCLDRADLESISFRVTPGKKSTKLAQPTKLPKLNEPISSRFALHPVSQMPSPSRGTDARPVSRTIADLGSPPSFGCPNNVGIESYHRKLPSDDPTGSSRHEVTFEPSRSSRIASRLRETRTDWVTRHAVTCTLRRLDFARSPELVESDARPVARTCIEPNRCSFGFPNAPSTRIESRRRSVARASPRSARRSTSQSPAGRADSMFVRLPELPSNLNRKRARLLERRCDRRPLERSALRIEPI